MFSSKLFLAALLAVASAYTVLQSDVECKSEDEYLGIFTRATGCEEAVRENGGKFFVFGKGFWKAGQCYQENIESAEDCEPEEDTFDFYTVESAEEMCEGLECGACLDFVPADGESYCGFVGGSCLLASKAPITATDAVWESNMCPGAYNTITSGTCDSNGFVTLSSAKECEEAAGLEAEKGPYEGPIRSSSKTGGCVFSTNSEKFYWVTEKPSSKTRKKASETYQYVCVVDNEAQVADSFDSLSSSSSSDESDESKGAALYNMVPETSSGSPVVYGFALLGLGFLFYGAAQHYFFKTEEAGMPLNVNV